VAPRWVLLDLHGTLLDPASVAPAMPGGVGDREAAAHAALDAAVTQAMALTMAGLHRPFPDLVAAGFRIVLERAGLRPDDGTLAPVVAAAGVMAPHEDAEPGMRAMAAAGSSLAVLTNGTADGAAASLGAAGLDRLVLEVVSAEEVRAAKPDPRVYRHALERLEADETECCLVSAHWWDVLGAREAGLHTGWVARREATFPVTVPDPSVSGGSLLDVAEGVAALA
jgi:2-haloacid dehalogenase